MEGVEGAFQILCEYHYSDSLLETQRPYHRDHSHYRGQKLFLKILEESSGSRAVPIIEVLLQNLLALGTKMLLSFLK